MAAKRRQVQLTPLAETDLEEIWPYTSQRRSLKQAEHYHHDLVESRRWRGMTRSAARGRRGTAICAIRLDRT